MAENPYRPPQAKVSDPAAINPQDNLILVFPKKLPAANGWNWIKQGFGYFMASPVIWIVNIIILLLLMMFLAFIPLLGGLAMHILTPIFSAGLMTGCADQDKGKPLEVNHLFAGFKKNTGNLALLGLLYMAGIIIVVMVIAMLVLLFGGASGQFASLAGMDSSSQPSPDQIQSLMSMGGIAMLLGLALIIPLVMAYYFAPVLIIQHDLGVIEAMKLSFSGCLKNMLPFLIYGIVAFVLAVVASIPFFLGWLVLGPILTAAVYASYKDIFTEVTR